MSLTSLFGFLVLLYTLHLLLHALLLGTFNIFDLCLSEKKRSFCIILTMFILIVIPI